MRGIVILTAGCLSACVARPEHYLEECDSRTPCENPDLECAYRDSMYTASPGTDGKVAIAGDQFLCSLPCESHSDCPEANCNAGVGVGGGSTRPDCTTDGYCVVDCYE